MKIYIISLKRRREKLNKLLASLPKILMSEDIHVFDAVDGLECDIPKWFDVTTSKKIIAGNYGCYLSHLEIIKKIDSTTMILEDDAIFSLDFNQKYKEIINYLPNINYDIFYLGGQNIRPALPTKNTNIYQCSKTYRTHAYIISGKDSAKNIQLLLENPKLWHKHLLKTRYHIDHFYGALQNNQIIKSYCIQPFICGQDESLMSDVTPAGYIPIRW